MVHTRSQRRREDNDFREGLRRSMQTPRRDNLFDMIAEQGQPRLQRMLRAARRGRYIKRYKDNDWAHRHRIEDDQEKDVQVTSYSRRS